MRLSLALSAAALLVLGFVACDSGGGGDDESGGEESTGAEQSPETPSGPVETERQLNQAFALEHDFQATITGLETRDTTGEIIANTEVYLSRPAEGSTFVVVTYDVTNAGAEPRGVPGYPVLHGADGTEYDVNTSATAHYVTHQQYPGAEAPRGDVAPGESRTLAKVYEVPLAAWSAAGFRVVYEVDPWASADDAVTNWIAVGP